MHKLSEVELYRDFGKRVRQHRTSAGLLQADVASALHLTRASVTNLEAGRQRPVLHQIYELAQVLHVEVQDLLPTPPAVDVDQERHDALRERILSAADLA